MPVLGRYLLFGYPGPLGKEIRVLEGRKEGRKVGGQMKATINKYSKFWKWIDMWINAEMYIQ